MRTFAPPHQLYQVADGRRRRNVGLIASDGFVLSPSDLWMAPRSFPLADAPADQPWTCRDRHDRDS